MATDSSRNLTPITAAEKAQNKKSGAIADPNRRREKYQATSSEEYRVFLPANPP
jgi:hypothetical protein